VTPTLIAQLSDPHLRLDDASTHAALAAAVDRVLKVKPLPAAVLLTGDIANTGDPREHELAAELLSRLPMPVHRLAGNHDLLPERTNYAVETSGVRLVACDTSLRGRDDGHLELDWLAGVLAEAPDAPTIVAMHHPPIDIGLPWLDEIGLPASERAGLAELLRASPQVKRVVAGHVHRTITGTLGGCPVVTCSSTNIQAGLDFVSTDVELVVEPPSILVHALLDGEVVSHAQPV
jgi:Icc protein